MSLDIHISALSDDVANQHGILEMRTNDDDVHTPLCSHSRGLLISCLHLWLQLLFCVTAKLRDWLACSPVWGVYQPHQKETTQPEQYFKGSGARP